MYGHIEMVAPIDGWDVDGIGWRPQDWRAGKRLAIHRGFILSAPDGEHWWYDGVSGRGHVRPIDDGWQFEPYNDPHRFGLHARLVRLCHKRDQSGRRYSVRLLSSIAHDGGRGNPRGVLTRLRGPNWWRPMSEASLSQASVALAYLEGVV